MPWNDQKRILLQKPSSFLAQKWSPRRYHGLLGRNLVIYLWRCVGKEIHHVELLFSAWFFMNYKFFGDKIGAGGLLLFLLIAATIRGQLANHSIVCLPGCLYHIHCPSQTCKWAFHWGINLHCIQFLFHSQEDVEDCFWKIASITFNCEHFSIHFGRLGLGIGRAGQGVLVQVRWSRHKKFMYKLIKARSLMMQWMYCVGLKIAHRGGIVD